MMSTSRRALRLLVLPLAVALHGCDGNTGPGDDTLVVDVQVAPGHIHSFESEVTFTVTVTDSRGREVSDFTTIRAEIGVAGAEQWTKQVPLLFDGAAYVGSTPFTATGSFDVRIVGQRSDQSAAAELHRLDTTLDAVRPHFDAGGYRVEFETSTGEYPVRGEEVTFRFLIMEDVPSPRPPVSGLAGVALRCTQGSLVEVHAASESPAGTYSAPHTFDSEGGATAQVEFTGSDGNPAIVQIPLVVF
ncbi:MAG: hypothetical protein ACT4PE_06005 [Candidatus Eiseniibacteriota bacterium]